jgi:glycosyltransferase involved in cell wall biosynthesis
MMSDAFLFITRNFPPQVGGLENYSYHLIREFEKKYPTHKITLGRPKKHLGWFLPYCCIKALSVYRRCHPSNIHLCDGVLAPVGIILKRTTRARISITIHGLDVTFGNYFYQRVIPRWIASMDAVICVSRSTRDACVQHGISRQKCYVISNGIDPAEFQLTSAEETQISSLEALLQFSFSGKKILLSVGRLVTRKGIGWFVANVMPRLTEDYCYLVAGEGPEWSVIQAIVQRQGLGDRVFLLGRVSDKARVRLYHAADVFIMPNIERRNDVEGFGIAAIEAGSCGLPVVASDLQGLRDAVLHGRTGFLVEPGNISGFVDRITSMPLCRDIIRTTVNTRFNWTTIRKRYYEVLVNRDIIVHRQP